MKIYGNLSSSCSWTISEPRSWDETSKARANKAEPGKTSARGARRVRCQLYIWISDVWWHGKIVRKKIEQKKHRSAFLSSEDLKKHFWVLHHFRPRRWDAADHVLLTELQALTTASMTASSRAHGPHLETKDGNVECSQKRTNDDKWEMLIQGFTHQLDLAMF